MMDLSGHETSELEVVGEGGSMLTPAMLSPGHAFRGRSAGARP